MKVINFVIIILFTSCNYNRNDKDQETIGRVITTSRLQAAKIFAERKRLPLKEFLKIWGVITIL